MKDPLTPSEIRSPLPPNTQNVPKAAWTDPLPQIKQDLTLPVCLGHHSSHGAIAGLGAPQVADCASLGLSFPLCEMGLIKVPTSGSGCCEDPFFQLSSTH